MTEKELEVLRQLTPQDYLQFMQAVWAQLTIQAPSATDVRGMFSIFSGMLNELETIVVMDLKPRGEKTPVILSFIERHRKEMDDVYLNLMERLNEQGRVGIKSMFNELTQK